MFWLSTVKGAPNLVFFEQTTRIMACKITPNPAFGLTQRRRNVLENVTPAATQEAPSQKRRIRVKACQ
tara:strand:- start:2364 stop:2567 length:204 start_codon:yes stop_codon:yes gene_type:complete